MKISISLGDQRYTADMSAPIDISIPLKSGSDTVNCFYIPWMEAAPIRVGSFVGSVLEGGSANCFNVKLNPHGNGTHTECVGHISKEPYTINQCLKEFFHLAQVVTIFPEKIENGDRVIMRHQLENLHETFNGQAPKAIVIRTMPNDELKLRTNYSGANPTYLHHEAAAYLAAVGIEHLLLDLPSVDREEDGGLMLAHRAYWQYPDNTRVHATITELIFVPTAVKDGHYLLHHQITAMEIDATPSKPVLYALEPA